MNVTHVVDAPALSWVQNAANLSDFVICCADSTHYRSTKKSQTKSASLDFLDGGRH